MAWPGRGDRGDNAGSVEGSGCSPRQCPPRKASCVDSTVCQACASVHACGAKLNVRGSEGHSPPASPPGAPLREWPCPVMDVGMGEGGWGHGRAGPLGEPQCREAPWPRTHLQWQQSVLSSSTPGPSAWAPSTSSCLFPPGEGRGPGRDSKNGVPEIPGGSSACRTGSTHPSLVGGGHAWALRGPASLGDSVPVYPRHVLGSPGTCCSPARRAGGEPGSGPGPSLQVFWRPQPHLHASEPLLPSRGWRALLRPTPSAWRTEMSESTNYSEACCFCQLIKNDLCTLIKLILHLATVLHMQVKFLAHF